MRACQIEQRDKDTEETRLHIQPLREHDKELSDEKLQLRSPPLDEGKLLVMILGWITIPVAQRSFGLVLSGLGSPIIKMDPKAILWMGNA